MIDRKRILRDYKETPLPMGIFRVRNTVTGKVLLGTSVNLPGMLNRQRFQLEMGGHPNQELDRELREYGAEAFEVEVVDTLEPPDDVSYDPKEDLLQLLEMWRDRARAQGVALYER